jgi:ABC-type multidrug transport system fused ATPase/permease subunit
MERSDPAPRRGLKGAWPQIWAIVRPRRGLLLLGLGIMLVNRFSGLVLPASAKYLVDDVLGRGNTGLLLPLVGAVLAATAVQAATSFALFQLLSKAAQRLIAELRRKIQSHVGRLPVAYYDANKTGTLISRIMTDVEGVRNLVGTGLVEFAGGLVTAAVALGVLLTIHATLTLVAAACLAVFVLGLKRAFTTLRPMYRERGKINAEVTGRLSESLGGVRVVKGYHAERREEAVFAGGVDRLLRNILATLTGTAWLSVATTVLMGVVGAAVMFVGAREIQAGRLTLGQFLQYNIFLGYLAAPVFQIVNIGTQITEAVAGLDRAREVLGERPEDEDPARSIAPAAIRGDVRFEDVDFHYEAGKPVLKKVSFHAEPGTVTALVGSSGSGKSTIINLIAAFYKAVSGRVLLDGLELDRLRLDAYRAALGVVLQESFLFDGTIRENVAFSRPEAAADDVLRVCRIARVDEFAEKFPEGYDTVVGERGVKLSGGQRQRISIARALLADPRILILDEATSSLDSESEGLIQQGLSKLMEGRTTFVIAHRMSTIRRANQILVIEGGEVVERGTHESLYAARGRYYELYTRQQGLERNLFLAPGEGESAPESPDAAPAPSSEPPRL